MDGARNSFISSTYWTESVGPAAALATLEKMRRIDVPAHCRRVGGRAQQAWRESAATHGLPVEVLDGYPALAHFSFKHDLAQELGTLYVRGMLERGFLGSVSLYSCIAHTDEMTDLYIEAIDGVFADIAQALDEDSVGERVQDEVAFAGFRRLL